MNNVYIVCGMGMESTTIFAVFSTKLAAELYVRRKEKKKEEIDSQDALESGLEYIPPDPSNPCSYIFYVEKHEVDNILFLPKQREYL